jgi:choline dehydrogenase-like flavoprotein
MAINSRPRADRGSCLQLGFCFQGCKSGAKWSALYTEVAAAERTGNMELRTQAHVAQIELDAGGKAVGVVYFDAEGKQQRQRARAVCVAGNSIETPRLLLLSASSKFPDGMANSSGQVGRNYQRHTTGSVYAIMDEPVHMYRGTTMAGIISEEIVFDPSRGFAGGYELETLSLGLPFMAAFLNPGEWGRPFAQAMDLYSHMAGMWIVGEDMPQQANRVTLNSAEKDQWGLAVPNVHYDDHPNDVAMRNHAYERGRAVYEAVGARKVFYTPPYPSTHNLGTCRMSASPRDGVCNKYGQTHDVKNLYVTDASAFVSSGCQNPTLTIMALTVRAMDHLMLEMKAGNV